MTWDDSDDDSLEDEPFEDEPLDDEPSSNLAAVLIGLVGLGALCWFAYYYVQLNRSRIENAHRREAKLVAHLREVGAAQVRFADADLDRDGVYDFASRIEELIVVTPRSLSQSYFVETGTLGEAGWYVVADPRRPGMRCFYLDDQGVVYVSTRPIEGPIDPLDLPAGVSPFGASRKQG